MSALAEARASAVRVFRDEWPPEVEQEWRRVAEELGNAFVTPEWFRSSLAHYGDECAPRVVAASRPDRLSLLPLARSRGRTGTSLRFGGSNLGDVFEVVAPPGADRALGALADALREEADILVLDNVEGDWPLELARALGGGVVATQTRRATLPVVEFGGGSGDDYLRSLSRNLRSQLKRKRTALERHHAVRFRLADEEHVAADIEQLFRLHDARWSGRGGSSLTSGRARRVLRDFAHAALAHRWLRLWLLEADERPIAAWYGWRLGSRYAYYTAGFDPAFGQFSPGLLLLAHSICSAADEGAATYEFLLGDESYKSRFATGARTIATFVLAPRLHPARLAAAAEEGARALVRRLPPRARDLAHAGARPVVRLLPTARSR